MNKITTQRVLYLSILSLLLFSASAANPVKSASYASINNQLGIGSTGNDVINLQTFLASNHDIYPEGIISGYYGRLTAKAVMQFQLYYGISMVGYVGPLTLAKINSVIASGYGIDIYGPLISNVSIEKTSTSAVLSWNTSETARGKVYYSTAPFQLIEAVGNFTGPVIIGGSSMVTANAQSNQSINIQNLQPNTMYYYIIESTDFSGNVTVTPQSTFSTPS